MENGRHIQKALEQYLGSYMIITIPLQFEAFRTRGDGTRILSFSTYEEHAEEVSKILNGPLGQEYIGMFIQTDSPESSEFISETPEQTKDRFYKRFHALITDIAKIKGMQSEDFKATVKVKLKSEGMIKESTKELTLEQLVIVISRLKKLHDSLK